MFEKQNFAVYFDFLNHIDRLFMLRSFGKNDCFIGIPKFVLSQP
jgi:hypothetical protein